MFGVLVRCYGRRPRVLEIAAGEAWLLKYNFYEMLCRKGRKVKATPYLHSPAFLHPLVLPTPGAADLVRVLIGWAWVGAGCVHQGIKTRQALRHTHG